MKRTLALLLCMLTLLLSATRAEEGLPAFVYQGDDTCEAALCTWLLENEAPMYAEGDVAIPQPFILEVDDSDPADALVWGDFQLTWYDLYNTTLISVSGGSYPGCAHLAATDGGCVVVSVDVVGDGDEWDADVQRIFGAREGLLERFATRSEALQTSELRWVGDYVRWNGLNITQCQAYGWPPEALPGAPETAEADQIVHQKSDLGYALDYDLRQFSFDRLDDATEILGGVGALEGIMIVFEAHPGKQAAAVQAALATELEAPRTETVSFGADQVEAVRLWDGSLHEEVARDAYILESNGGCLVVIASNTYYACEGDPVVPGADAALARVLDTIRIAE